MSSLKISFISLMKANAQRLGYSFDIHPFEKTSPFSVREGIKLCDHLYVKQVFKDNQMHI